MLPKAIIAQRFPEIVIPLIEAAKYTIDIIVYDWRWYPSVGGTSVQQFNDTIVAAAKRGVTVRALVNGDGIASLLQQRGITARRLHSKRMLHTKMMLIDGTHLIIGSHNYTQHGFSLNEEASLYVQMPAPENDFALYFSNLWGL